MTPKKTHLGVRPLIPTLVGLGAVALLAAAVSAHPQETPGKPLAPRKRAPEFVKEEVSRTTPTPVEPVRPQVDADAGNARQQSRITAVPAVPPAAEEDVLVLQEWILSLPQADLRAFDEAGGLNRRLAQIVAEVSHANPEGSATELDRFLTRLNARLGVETP